MDDASPMVNQHDENKEDAQARSGDREEIEGDQIPDLVDEECSPQGFRDGHGGSKP